jgi:hypothetical protein
MPFRHLKTVAEVRAWPRNELRWKVRDRIPNVARTVDRGRGRRAPRRPLDVALLMIALPLARRAQRVIDTPLGEIVAGLPRPGPWPATEPERVALAASRASWGWHRWFGGINSCLTRSLVTGAMLATRGEVVLHVGLRPGDGDHVVDGHAWITIDGVPVGADGVTADERFTRIVSVPFTEDLGVSR